MRRTPVVLMSMCFVFVSVAALAQQKPRVFITDSKSWEVSGGGGGSSSGFGGGTHGGARPQTAEIIKTFGERCPQVVVNNIQERSDYVVLLDHEGGKGFLRKDNKVAVFEKGGDSIISTSTRSLGNSVATACEAIVKDWPARSTERKAEADAPADAANETAATAPPELANAKLQISSDPSGADIEVDGNFVGNTPSTIDLPAGEHSVSIKKSGFKDWQRKIKTSGGSVNLAAQLEKTSGQ